MTIWLLRHGRTHYNDQRRYQGRLDIPLNENGLALAHVAGQGLADVHFDAVISSPLTTYTACGELYLHGLPGTKPKKPAPEGA